MVEGGGKRMGMRIEGKVGKGVRGKEVGLYMMWKMRRRGGRGYFVEYGGEAIGSVRMEGGVRLWKLWIEMGGGGGMIGGDEVRFE